MKENIRVHIFVSGIVQGVFFRAHTQETANRLSLTGWVRNIYDGRVEIIAEGTKENLLKLVAWCNQGPPNALIEDVIAQWQEATDEFKNFDIRYHY